MTPPNTISSSLASLSNPVTARLTKPIATVSPLHTSKDTNYRMQEKLHDEQLIDLSKSTCTTYAKRSSLRRRTTFIMLSSSHPPADEMPLKLESKGPELVNAIAPPERKKRSRQTSSSTTRTKVSRNSNRSNHDDGTDSNKSLKKTLSHTHPNPYLPPPASQQQQQQQQQQMLQSFFHTFQNQANYWPMTPWPVPPSLALMADPRNYYSQPWPNAHPSSTPHGPKDLSSASLNDFIGDTLPSTSASVFPMPPPPPSVLLTSTPNFSRTSSSNSLHLHHGPPLHRPATLNGTLS